MANLPFGGQRGHLAANVGSCHVAAKMIKRKVDSGFKMAKHDSNEIKMAKHD